MIPEKFNIRDYSPDDFEEVTLLWEATEMDGSQRGDNNAVIEKTIELGGKLIILENKINDEIVGTSWLTVDGRRIYLHHFGIHPKYQGMGYSKILLQESLNFAKDLGLQIKLEVHRSNEIAIELYKRAKFEYLGDYLVFIIRDYQNR